MNYNKGLFLDSNLIDQPEGTYRYLLNGMINKTLGAVCNELGTTEVVSVANNDDSIVIGHLYISESEIYLFTVNTSGFSSISVIRNGESGKELTTVIDDNDFSTPLGFRVSHSISATYTYNINNELLIYWTDGLNPPRYYNVTEPQNLTDINNISLFTIFSSLPDFTVTNINNIGGSLKSGSYHLAFSLVDKDFNETNIIARDTLVLITDDNTQVSNNDGFIAGNRTSKSVDLEISTEDTNYRYFNLYVVRYADGVYVESYKITNNLLSTSGVTSFTITGSETIENASLESILINKVYYEKIKTLTQIDGVLYGGNVTKRTDLGYQKFANNIKVTAVTKKGHDLTNAGERVNALDESFTLRGSFQRDEVYALYISLIQKDGSETYGYHIAGRAAEEEEIENPTVNRSIFVVSNPTTVSYPLDSDKMVCNPDYFASGVPFTGTVNFQLVTPSFNINFNTYFSFSVHNTMSTNAFIDAFVLAFRNLPQYKQGAVDLQIEYKTDNNEASIRLVALRSDGLGAYIRCGTNEFQNNETVFIRQDGEMVYNINTNAQYSTTPISLETITKVKLERINIANNNVDYKYTTKTVPGQHNIPNATTIATVGAGVLATRAALKAHLEADVDFNSFIYTAQIATIPLGKLEINVNNDLYYYKLTIEQHSNTRIKHFTVNNAQTSSPYVGQEAGNLTDQTDIHYTEFNDVTNLKNFHLKSSESSVYNTGFWENENESYPNNSNWDIFDVDENGEAVDTGDTLRNAKVRHHKFSGIEYQPYCDYDTDNAGVKNSNEYAIYLGIKLSNIKIPNNIKDKIIGYKIYYAKRNQNNSTVIGQGFCFSAALDTYGDQHSIENIVKANAWYDSYKYFNDGDSTGSDDVNDLSPRIFQFYDFNLLRTRNNISGVNYIKINKYFNIDYFGRNNIPNGNGRHISFQIGKETSKFTPVPDLSYNGSTYSQAIRRLQAISYVDSRAELTKLRPLGFSYDFYNKWYESKIVFETKNLPLNTQGGYIVTLKSFKKDCYLDFDNQELVCCYSSSDLNRTETDDIFSGDVHINGFAFKATDCIGVLNDDLTDDLVDYDRIGFYRIVTECRDNIIARYEGDNYNEVYYPKSDIASVAILDVSSSDYINKEQDTRGIGIDNWYGYSVDAHKRAELKSTIPFPKILEENIYLFNRVIRSQKNNFRSFLENDYKDLPLNRGSVINLEEHAGNLLIHTEKSLYTTRGKEELGVNDFRAFIGSGDIFAVEPRELYTSNEGYGGIKEKLSANKNKFGYFFVSLDERKIFWLSDNANEISSVGLGNFFRENLLYPKIIKSHNPLTYLSYEELSLIQNCAVVRTGFDPVFNRFFVTLQYKNPTTAFNTAVGTGDITFSNNRFFDDAEVDITDNPTYFTDVKKTISFLPEFKSWDAFHSYHPLYYITGLSELLLLGRGQGFTSIFKSGNGDSGNFLGEDGHEFEFTIVQTEDEVGQAVSLSYLADFLTSNGTKPNEEALRYANFNKFRVKTGLQDTTELDIIYHTLTNGNARYKQNQWSISGIREQNEDWTKRRKLRDRFFEITLKTDFTFNSEYQNYLLYLYNIFLLTR